MTATATMSVIQQAINASGDQRVIDAYNNYGALIEATVSAAASGKSGHQIYEDTGVQAALSTADTSAGWFVLGFLVEGGIVIGGIAFDINWPTLGKATFAATTLGWRIGGKGVITAGFMQSRDNCTGGGGDATLVAAGVALTAGLSAYFFFRGKTFLGFHVGIGVGIDVGFSTSLDGKFTAR
jgi:hypothetical protein